MTNFLAHYVLARTLFYPFFEILMVCVAFKSQKSLTFVAEMKMDN